MDSCSPADLLALTTILLGGTPAACTNRLLWIQAVKDHFDNVPLFVSNCKQLQLVFEAATHVGYEVHQADVGGCNQEYDLVVLLQGATPFPESGLHVSLRARNVQEGRTTPVVPQLVNIDCTGLGGHDLGGFKDYDICIRTDKHGQSIYGPSVSPLECAGRDGELHVFLGGSKAMHEFLILHYMATDSAEAWDNFLDQCLSHCAWVRAGSRRALALHMFDKCHIAPSHRRLAHPSWVASMKLTLDLLLGAGQKRYLCSRPFNNVPAQVYVRGFSAGSYSGICLLHILWSMPHVQVGGILGGIALPPVLLHCIPPEYGSQLMLIHLTTDRLCQWHPADDTLRSLPCKYCILRWSCESTSVTVNIPIWPLD